MRGYYLTTRCRGGVGDAHSDSEYELEIGYLDTNSLLVHQCHASPEMIALCSLHNELIEAIELRDSLVSKRESDIGGHYKPLPKEAELSAYIERAIEVAADLKERLKKEAASDELQRSKAALKAARALVKNKYCDLVRELRSNAWKQPIEYDMEWLIEWLLAYWDMYSTVRKPRSSLPPQARVRLNNTD